MSNKRFETKYSDFKNHYYYVDGMWPYIGKHIFCATEEYHSNNLKPKVYIFTTTITIDMLFQTQQNMFYMDWRYSKKPF